MKVGKGIISVFIFFCFSGCLKPFDPEIKGEVEGYLVVEGGVDTRDGKARIVLSQTKSLDVINQRIFETGAEVWVEAENGGQVFFEEKDKGVYQSDVQNYEPGLLYRLNIVTAAKETYQSDYVPFKTGPEIDSLTWAYGDEGVSIFLNTHDSSNKTRYYRWAFIETAEYNSFFACTAIYDENKKEVVPRNQETQNIYVCWNEESSKSILLSNTSGLSEDVVTHKKIQTLSPDSWKHQFKYSILVKQYALTAAEYAYWEVVKQSNENVGSIFDAQPSNIGGNIRSLTHPDSPVFGYFSIGASSVKRIFISQSELPHLDRARNVPSTCLDLDEVFVDITDYYADPSSYPLIKIVYNMSGGIIGITTGPIECIDCSLDNRGFTVKPDYWE
ncbi:MAG: DUF4249 domain-containing protein [Bacteroidia bacterium]